MDTLLLIAGLLLILWGANALTDGAASVAKKLNISNLVIGLTIVAFGTSAPEFVISFLSSLSGSAELAIGNVVGSNLFNTLMIVGCTAIVAPIPIGKGTLAKEIPLCVLSALMLLVCANDMLLDGGTANVIKNGDGEEGGEIRSLPMWKSLLFILLGLGALIGGGQLFVNGASGIARSLGVSESVIGLTLVAGGTSLPELATSVSAALKKNTGIAIGNVIGSNLFNAFAVLGASATINDLPLGGITNFDFMTLVVASLLLWVVGFFMGRRIVTRPEGIFLVACYVAYTTYLIMQQ